jgi:hypothetical protein
MMRAWLILVGASRPDAGQMLAEMLEMLGH